MIFDLGETRRRIYRDWDGTGVEDPREGNEKLPAGGEHQRDPITRIYAALDQTRCNPPGLIEELAVCESVQNRFVVFEHRDMKPVGMPISVPIQDLRKRARPSRRRNGRQRSGGSDKTGGRRMRLRSEQDLG